MGCALPVTRRHGGALVARAMGHTQFAVARRALLENERAIDLRPMRRPRGYVLGRCGWALPHVQRNDCRCASSRRLVDSSPTFGWAIVSMKSRRYNPATVRGDPVPFRMSVGVGHCPSERNAAASKRSEERRAKTTDRTALQNLLRYCRTHKGKVHFVVVYININRTASTAPFFEYLAPSESAEERVVSRDGIEPSTRRLRVCCSAN